MWTHAVLLFALCLGFYVRGDPNCGGVQGVMRTCNTWFDNRPSFPKTEEDVLDMCPKILSHLECVQNYVAECGNEGISEADNLPKFKVYLEDICKEDSAIRADIVKELPCIKDALDISNNTCFTLSREAMSNYVEENDPDYDDSPRQKYYCFYLTANLACMAAEFDINCGAGARDVLLDAFFRTGHLDNACEVDATDDLLKLVAVLELELAQKERIGHVLHSYQDFLRFDEAFEP